MLKRILSVYLLVVVSIGFAAEFQAGKDYQVLPEGKNQSSANVEVTEFFSYGCPWCYKLEKPLHQFIKKQGAQVNLKQIPVVFQPGWQVYAKAFYTAKRLNQLEKLSPAIFKAIQDDNQTLNTNKAMVAFFVDQGIDKATAENAFLRSPTIDSDVKQGSMAMVKYRIRGVPAVVVNGHYKLDLSMAKGIDRFFEILTYVISLEQKRTA